MEAVLIILLVVFTTNSSGLPVAQLEQTGLEFSAAKCKFQENVQYLVAEFISPQKCTLLVL